MNDLLISEASATAAPATDAQYISGNGYDIRNLPVEVTVASRRIAHQLLYPTLAGSSVNATIKPGDGYDNKVRTYFLCHLVPFLVAGVSSDLSTKYMTPEEFSDFTRKAEALWNVWCNYFRRISPLINNPPPPPRPDQPITARLKEHLGRLVDPIIF